MQKGLPSFRVFYQYKVVIGRRLQQLQPVNISYRIVSQEQLFIFVFRFDLRPFLYRTSWPWQFRSIDRAVASASKTIGTAQLDRSLDVRPLGKLFISRCYSGGLIIPMQAAMLQMKTQPVERCSV